MGYKKFLMKITPVLILLVVVAVILSYPLQFEDKSSSEFKNIMHTDSGENFKLEVAETPQERQKGLQNREELKEDGMIFLYSEEDYRSFWMKNTKIDLDIIFLDENKKVVNIKEAKAGYNKSEEDLKSYESDKPAKYVLEIEKGKSKEKGILTNSTFEFE